MSESLFHYTDVSAVRSILENTELWLTDIRFLNDTQELNDGAVFIVDALDKILEQSSSDAFLRDAAVQLKNTFDDHVSLWIDDEPTFVCSFSKAANQLSQWRAYGAYAIEFDRELLGDDVDLFECVYEYNQKIYTAEEMSNDAVRGLANDFETYDGSCGPDSLDYLSMLVRTASIFKNPSFHEEQEVRYAIDLQLPSRRQKFRQRGNILIPYTAAKITLECIKAIHVGPMHDQNLAYTSMRAFVSGVLSRYRADGGNVEHEIDVVKSEIPYRAS